MNAAQVAFELHYKRVKEITMPLHKNAHFQPKMDKAYLIDDVLECVRAQTNDEKLELPSLKNMTRRDLDILANAMLNVNN